MKSALRKHKMVYVDKYNTDKTYYAILKNKDTNAEKVIDTTATYRNQAENYFIEYAIRNNCNIQFIGVYKK